MFNPRGTEGNTPASSPIFYWHQPTPPLDTHEDNLERMNLHVKGMDGFLFITLYLQFEVKYKEHIKMPISATV